MQTTAINAALQTLKSSARACCSLACFMWLTLQIVLACRLQSCGLESAKQKREWLEERFEQMEKKRVLPNGTELPYSSTIRYDYAIDVVGFEQRSVCIKAFDFAYDTRQEPTIEAFTRKRRLR